jgi:tetratricopeptide (TPR) repeat protein
MMDSVGQIFERLGALQDAERCYRDALSYNPKFALAHFHLGGLYLRAGRTTEAGDELRLFRSQWATADEDAPEVVAARKMLDGIRP